MPGSKLFLFPVALSVTAFLAVFGVIARANNDILVGGMLWEQGMPFWEPSITIEPGQEFKVTLFASHINPDSQAVTGISLVDNLPQYTSYLAGTSFEILVPGGSWQALADDTTTPFDGAGVSPHGGVLEPLEFANYKYTVEVDDFLPTGTSQLSWAGPIFNFTDLSGAQSKGNSESTSINVASLPSILSFSLNASTYKLGDTITATATGDAGKAVHVEIGSISFNLGGSGANYTGTYTVQAGDGATGTSRVFFAHNGTGTGSYRDAASSVTIDGVVPPAPTNLSASVDSGTLVATITWTAASPETDVSQYNIYSNNGSGSVNYTTPIATVLAGTTQYVTSPLSSDSLYTFAVRSQDAVGNIEQNADTANAATDFTPPDPPDSLVRPTTLNDTVVKFGPSNSLQFVWAPSLSVDVARYRVEVDDNSDFSSIIASLETVGAGTSLTATSTQVTLPDGVYSWRVSAIDDAENVSTPQTAPDNTFEIDTTNPDSVTYDTPVNGNHIAGNFTATGTASDAGTHMSVSGSSTGIAKIEVFLQNFTANPVEYWDGSAWVTTQTWLTAGTADNFTNWTYDFTASITDGTSYFTGARVTDQAGNTLDSALVSLTGNTTSPNVNITSPANGSYQASAVVVAGTASDPGGTVISDASVSIQRSSDSMFWDNAAWVAGVTWNVASTADSFANWTYNFNPDFSAPEGTVYTITARATDGVYGTPNTGVSAARTTVKDSTAPTVAITSPLAANSPFNAASWDAANPIAGTALDALSGVSGVQVAIQDSSGNYWNGTDWTSPSAGWFSATSSDSFATWKYIDAGADFIPNKDDSFTVYARGTDSAIGTANTSAPVSQAVIYDTTAPAVANAVVTNSTVNNITTLIKNGDVFILSATITDALGQSGMSVASITADIAALTGNPSDTAVAPASYNTTTGGAVWNFAAAAGTGDGDLSVTINATDPAGNAVAFTDTAIIVADNTAPAVPAATLTAPSAAGITWAGGSTQTITWTSGDITDTNLAANPITLEYATSTAWNLIAANESNDGTFDWTVPSIDSNTVQVRITAADQVNNTSNDVSDNQFTIDSTPPAVPTDTLIAPNGGEAWKQGTVQNITWNSAGITDNFGLAVGPIVLQYFTDTSGFVNIASIEDNDGIFSWTTPILDDTTVRVRMIIYDAAGNSAIETSDAHFAIGLPPVIVEAQAVSDALIEIEWDKSLANAGAFANYTATGITATAAAVNGTNDKIVELTVNSLGDTAFTAADLAVSAGTVTDTFNFQNEAVAGQAISDRQSPVTNIAGSYPNSTQLIVDYSPRIRIAVSEAPDLGATDFQLDGVSQAVAHNAGMIEFNTAATLAPGRHSISLDLVDVAGNAEANQTWDFWIDQLTMSVAANPVSYLFNGNVTDESDASEQQTVSVSTYGAGYAIYARFNPDLLDGAGNSISDVDIKQAAQTWADKIDLNGTTLVSVVNVEKLAPPNLTPRLDTHTFDLRATIAGIAQPAGDYAGTLEFIVAPEY